MAYKAEAELTGVEYCKRGMLIKDVNIPLLAITVTRGGRMRMSSTTLSWRTSAPVCIEWKRHTKKETGPRESGSATYLQNESKKLSTFSSQLKGRYRHAFSTDD
jgi:hypothetical protein